MTLSNSSDYHVKPIILIFVCFFLLMPGCMTHLRVTRRPLGQIIADYRSIEKGMTEQQVIARLGEPNNVEGNEVSHWEEGSSSASYADLRVSFDAGRQVRKTSVWSTNDSSPSISDRLINPPGPPADPRYYTLPGGMSDPARL